MPQTNDEVINVVLQAACIRAAAQHYGDTRLLIDKARDLYREATLEPWVRGDARLGE